MEPKDTNFLARALLLAMHCPPDTAPNPRVGCIIVNPSDEIIGQGNTQRCGGHHAEVMALKMAQENNKNTHGASAYVTLEPCSHHGRTPPCCDSLIRAGLSKVFIIHRDPNPLVNGHGIERLRAAGMTVMVLEQIDSKNDLVLQAYELNIGFFNRVKFNRPWVRLKIAMSMDGFSALENGDSKWITSTESRTDVHHLRSLSCGILTGIGSVLADDSSLNVRLVPCLRQPHAIVIDSELRTPPAASILQCHDSVFIYTKKSKSEILKTPFPSNTQITTITSVSENHGVNLDSVLKDLAITHQMNEVLVEAGSILSGAFLRENKVDELILYIAPKFLGNGIRLANLPGLTQLDQAHPWRLTSSKQFSNDIRLTYRYF